MRRRLPKVVDKLPSRGIHCIEATLVVSSFFDYIFRVSKQRQPDLARELPPAVLTVLDDAELEKVRLENCVLAKQKGERVRFNEVRILGSDLSETKVSELKWIDVECDRCQLWLLEWTAAELTRVVLRDCRATGSRWTDSELQDVRFIGCQLECASFSSARFNRVSFEGCNLRDADFGGADLSGTAFVGCDLQGASLVGAKLTGADIRTSFGNDLHVEARDVRGLIVNAQQAAALAPLFGLVVRDGA